MSITEELKSKKLLTNWSGYSLEKRVVQIEKMFGIKTSLHGLHKFYKKHDIKLRRGDYMYKKGLSSRENN